MISIKTGFIISRSLTLCPIRSSTSNAFVRTSVALICITSRLLGLGIVIFIIVGNLTLMYAAMRQGNPGAYNKFSYGLLSGIVLMVGLDWMYAKE